MAKITATVKYTNSTHRGQDLFCGVRPTHMSDLFEAYDTVVEFESDSKASLESIAEAIFRSMQGSFMSDEILAQVNRVIDSTSVCHTSMSIGDIVILEREDSSRVSVMYCAMTGFIDISDSLLTEEN